HAPPGGRRRRAPAGRVRRLAPPSRPGGRAPRSAGRALARVRGRHGPALRRLRGLGPLQLRRRRDEPPRRVRLRRVGASAAVRLGGITYATNADGFRDRTYPRAKPPGTFRVVVLGDSITLGWGVALEESFPKRLEQRLGPSVQVLSLGVAGYNPYTEAQL